MSGNGIKALSICLVGTVSWYAGIKFWKPLIVYVYELNVIGNALLTV